MSRGRGRGLARPWSTLLRRWTLDAQQLRDHLDAVPEYVERFRHEYLTNSGRVVADDVPIAGEFASKSPGNDNAQEVADAEAAFVGNLARYCMAMGSIPRKTLRGFWWVDGECKGILGSSHYDDALEALPYLWQAVRHIKAYAAEVLETEGVEPILQAGLWTRSHSVFYFPFTQKSWVTIDEACAIADRKKDTIQRWRQHGWVEQIDDDSGVMLNEDHVRFVADILGSRRSGKGRSKPHSSAA